MHQTELGNLKHSIRTLVAILCRVLKVNCQRYYRSGAGWVWCLPDHR